jgi:ElaB/YqjD/DUF883 family membrane-anchored ribosome-binding protein
MTRVSSEKLIDDLKAVVTDAEELLRATAGQAGEKISAIRTRAQDSVRLAKERMSEMQEDLVEQTRELAENADEYVHRNPWQAIGLAAVAGFAIGLMVSRGR